MEILVFDQNATTGMLLYSDIFKDYMKQEKLLWLTLSLSKNSFAKRNETIFTTISNWKNNCPHLLEQLIVLQKEKENTSAIPKGFYTLSYFIIPE